MTLCDSVPNSLSRMPSADLPGQQTEPHCSDNSSSQDSEPLSEGSLSASVSSAVSQATGSAAQSQVNSFSRSQPASSEQSAQVGASSQNQLAASNESQQQTPRDEPDCLLDLIVNSVSSSSSGAAAQINSELYIPHNANSDVQVSNNDNPPSYTELKHSSGAEDKSKPPRYKTILPKYEGSPQEQAELSSTDDETSSISTQSNGNLSSGDQPVLRIGINLLRASKRLLDFLSVVNCHPELYTKEVITGAIYRFVNHSRMIQLMYFMSCYIIGKNHILLCSCILFVHYFKLNIYTLFQV